MSTEFTAKDGQFFQLILMNMTNMPKVNWVLIAEKAGYNSAKVAQTRFGQIKKKLTTCANESRTTSSSSPATPMVSPRKRKASSSEEEDEMPLKMKSVGKRSGKAFKRSAYDDAIAAIQDEEPESSSKARDSDEEFSDEKKDEDDEA